MREALPVKIKRRYRPPAMAEVLSLLRAEAHVKGLGRISTREIDKAVSETRSEMRTERKRTSQIMIKVVMNINVALASR